MSKRGGLGRGLSALIPGAPEAGEAASGLMEVPVHAVAPNPKQPRTRFDDETIATLAASIREVGILQPLVVRRAGDGRYELIAGERRLRAAKAAGLASVPIVLRDSEDADLLREALIENIHREDLSVRHTEDIVRRFLEVPQATEDKRRVAESLTAKADANLAEVEEILSEQLATRVSIQMGAKRGKVVIEFGSPDDLERIVSEI